VRTYYKVTVEAEIYDDSGEFVRTETLFAASNSRAEALLRFAPTEVDDALRVVAGVVPMAPGHALGGVVSVPDWDRASEATPVDGAAVPQPETETSVATAAPKTRKRRTKAEIEADKVREAAETDPQRGLKDAAAAGVPVEAPLVPAETEPAPPAAPVAAPEPVPAEAPPAAPWNPFQQR
jgi:hypothetical protein